jgi:hypothetical protein
LLKVIHIGRIAVLVSQEEGEKGFMTSVSSDLSLEASEFRLKDGNTFLGMNKLSWEKNGR